jgi:hypothetical protein
MAKIEKYVFRFDNWNYNEDDYSKLHQWCGMYEIPIKYIGKAKGRRCRWLEIEITNPLLANCIINNMHYWQLYKRP